MSLARLLQRQPRGRALLCGALAAALALAMAPAAHATSIGEKIILRCTHGESLSGFSQSEYRQALEELQADSEEYSACNQEIRQAQRGAAQAGGHRGGAGAAAAAAAAEAARTPLTASPTELSSLASARRKGSGPVTVGGQVIRPGVVHADISSAISSLPAPLLAVLALMLACVIVFSAVVLRRRVRGRRTH